MKKTVSRREKILKTLLKYTNMDSKAKFDKTWAESTFKKDWKREQSTVNSNFDAIYMREFRRLASDGLLKRTNVGEFALTKMGKRSASKTA